MADRVGAELTALGLDWDEDDDAAPSTGSTPGNLYCRLPPTVEPAGRRSSSARTSTRCRSTARSSRSSRTASCGTPAARSSAPTTRRRSPRCSRASRRDRRGAAARTRASSSSSRRWRRSACAAPYAFDHTRLVARSRLRLRPGGADRRRSSSGAPWQRSIRRRASTGAPPTPGWCPRRDGRRSSRPRGRSPTCGSGGSTRRRPRTSGTIEGGTARNIVPEWCTLHGEARSHDEREARRDRPGDARRARVRRQHLRLHARDRGRRSCTRGYRFRRRRSRGRARGGGARARPGSSRGSSSRGGGADANVFNERGLACVNLANGMAEIHTPDEHIAVADLERMADVTVALVDCARGRG